jgi:ribonuclease R
MVKKTSRKQRYDRKNRKSRNRFRRKGPEPSLSKRILFLLSGREAPASTAVIMQELALPGSARKAVKEILTTLVKEKKIRQKNKKFFAATDEGLSRATVALTSRGFGFATVEGQKANEKDIFISSTNLNGASHGDTVLIRIMAATSRGRREGQVVRIVKRSVTTLCGVYVAETKGGHLMPDDPKLPFTVFIPRAKSRNAENGTAVLARITEYGTGDKGPTGEILEILGDPLTVAVQMRMAMEKLSLNQSFPAEVLEAAGQLKPLTTCDKDRRDLRQVPHVTIDGATAKDFDDAIAVEETADGFRLHVSIADVSHYVRTGSPIDREAYQRGTSVYFPGIVLPMLPERLSNDLCSLVPNQDRPAFSAILDFDRKGKQIRAEFCRSMINSHNRFTYDTVHRIVYLKEKNERKKYAELVPMLTTAVRLSTLLRKRRERRGSLGFTIPEAEIRIQDDRVLSIGHAKRNEAHLLIEDFMLAANEAVAEALAHARQEVLFRIHERPDPVKVNTFTEAAAAMGLQLAKTDISPAWFARVLDEARNKPAEYVVNNLLLRTMQRARYSPENLGHFGLAAKYYLHFTSPIRRYPDLIAHRVLHNFLVKQAGKGKSQSPVPGKDNLTEASIHLSARERVAVDGERDVKARLAGLFMLDRIGEEFDGVISGVTSFGLFIELIDYFISGAVPIRSMDNDYYLFDSRAHRLIGERSNTIYQLGHTVRIRLEHVDMGAKRITFSLVQSERVSKK